MCVEWEERQTRKKLRKSKTGWCWQERMSVKEAKSMAREEDQEVASHGSPWIDSLVSPGKELASPFTPQILTEHPIPCQALSHMPWIQQQTKQQTSLSRYDLHSSSSASKEVQLGEEWIESIGSKIWMALVNNWWTALVSSSNSDQFRRHIAMPWVNGGCKLFFWEVKGAMGQLMEVAQVQMNVCFPLAKRCLHVFLG